MSLMDEISSLDTLRRAIHSVQSNHGCAGIDGVKLNKGSMTRFVDNNLEKIRDDLVSGRYKPDKILRLHIPKGRRKVEFWELASGHEVEQAKGTGKTRPLGIPTVRDRIVQKAIQLVIEPRFEKQFLDCSFAFRPKRSTHQAAAMMRDFINDGYTHVVSMDLANCFGTLNHDKLMHHVREQIDDPQVLRLIRSYLLAEVSDGGTIIKPHVGVEQGGPLSPLLCNIYLHQLDLEMRSRGYAYIRFADDFRILKKSRAAAEAAMKSVSNFVERKLKLKVNREKSEVLSAKDDQFLGYAFRQRRQRYTLTIAPKSMNKFREQIAKFQGLGCRDPKYALFKLVWYCIGWIGQYKQCPHDDWRRIKVVVLAVSAAEQIRQSYAAKFDERLPPIKLAILPKKISFKAAMALVHSFAPDRITKPWESRSRLC